MKLYISAKRVLVTYAILGAVVLFAFYSLAGWIWPPTSTHYMLLAVWALSTILFVVLSLTQTYYILEGRNLVHHQINKEYVYDCKDILYVDEEYSQKHKTLCFYLDSGAVRYLIYDKKGLIYDHVMEKAINRISREEFQARFPNTRL